MHLCLYLVATLATCLSTFVKRSMFYSYIGPNVHSNVVSDVRRRLVCRMCGAVMVTGAGQWPCVIQEMEKGKEKPSQGMRSHLTVQQLIRRDEGEQTC